MLLFAFFTHFFSHSLLAVLPATPNHTRLLPPDAGYTVIATPYQVTFKHLECAAAVRRQLLDTVATLRAAGRGYLVPPAAPWHGVGHSNGALLHLLGGCDPLPPNWVSNTIISYNNK